MRLVPLSSILSTDCDKQNIKKSKIKCRSGETIEEFAISHKKQAAPSQN